MRTTPIGCYIVAWSSMLAISKLIIYGKSNTVKLNSKIYLYKVKMAKVIKYIWFWEDDLIVKCVLTHFQVENLIRIVINPLPDDRNASTLYLTSFRVLLFNMLLPPKNISVGTHENGQCMITVNPSRIRLS